MLAAGPCPSLDRLARAAAHQLRAGRAQVSLVGADRRVVAGCAGPPLAHSFCRLVVDTDAPLLVCDARCDERFGDHPAVADGVVAYAGFPLRSADGYVLGAFCVIDERPRDWEPRELLLIEDLAAAVETEIALRLAVRQEAAAARRLRGVLGRAADAYVSVDAYGMVLAWNAAAETLFGCPAADAAGRPVAELIIPERLRPAHEAGLAAIRRGAPWKVAGQRVEVIGRDLAGREFPVEMSLQVAVEDGEPPVLHAFLREAGVRARAHGPGVRVTVGLPAG
jgi:PAS domain S-box-containing protein